MGQYSINDLEKLSGVKAHTIRIWEKRYNLISPTRSDTNIRSYSDEELKRLLNIAILNNNGVKISHIAEMAIEEIHQKVVELTSNISDQHTIIESLVLAMVNIDEHSFEVTLGRSVNKLGFQETITNVIYPFFDKIGVLWQIGAINPYQEHFMSNLIKQKLYVAIDELQNPEHPKYTTLLFLRETELHELGLLFFNYILKKAGHKVVYLGQSVPFEDLEKIRKVVQIDILITSFISASPEGDISAYLFNLRALFESQPIWISGYQTMSQDITLPENVVHIKDISDLENQIRTLH